MEYILRKFFYEESKKTEKNKLFLLKEEIKLTKELMNEIMKHIYEKDFEKTKFSFWQFAFIPPICNIFISLSKNTRYMKFTLSLTSLLICFINVTSSINKDLSKFIDTEKGYKAKIIVNKFYRFGDFHSFIE